MEGVWDWGRTHRCDACPKREGRGEAWCLVDLTFELFNQCEPVFLGGGQLALDVL
jgi:hypothetical protein